MHLPEVGHLEDPDSESEQPAERPLRMALRNSAVALFGIAVAGGGFWLESRESGGMDAVWWWLWGATAAFVLIVCFAHAFLASLLGGRAAATALKLIVTLVLFGMIIAVWWSLQPKDGAH